MEPLVCWPGEERQEWEAEISSLTKEAETLRAQKQRLEEQIEQAQDANASLRSSWSALSRISTGAFSRKVGGSSQEPSCLEASDEASEAARRSLEFELRLLRQRLIDTEAAVAREQEETLALEEQKEQAKDLAQLLQELQVVQRRLSGSNSQQAALQRSEEQTQQALAALMAQRASLEEEMAAVREQLQSSWEATATAGREQRQALKAREELQTAQKLLEVKVMMARGAVEVEGKELAKMQARLQSCQLSKMEGQRAFADLRGRLDTERADHGRLLTWQQAPEALQERLELRSRAVQGELNGLDSELRRLRTQEAQDQAMLKDLRTDEVRGLMLREEIRCFEVCRSRLQNLSLEMQQEAVSLEAQLGQAQEPPEMPKPRRASSSPQLWPPTESSRSRRLRCKLHKVADDRLEAPRSLRKGPEARRPSRPPHR